MKISSIIIPVFVLSLILLAASVPSISANDDLCEFEGVPLTLAGLKDLKPAQLESLFRKSLPGPIPTTQVRGTVVRYEGRIPFWKLVRGVANGLWSGKIFYPQTGVSRTLDGTSHYIVSSLHNIVGGHPVFKGLVYKEHSWLENDDRDAWIIDYTDTAKEIAWIRDEFRYVGCGIYLGWTFDRTGGRKGKRFILNFAIDGNPAPVEAKKE